MEDYHNRPLPEEAQGSLGEAPGTQTGGDAGAQGAPGPQGVPNATPYTAGAPGYPPYPGVQAPYPYAPPPAEWPYGPYSPGGPPPVSPTPPQGYGPYPGGQPYPPAGWAPMQAPAPMPALDPARVRSAKRSAVMCLVFGCVSTLVSFVYIVLMGGLYAVGDLAGYPAFTLMMILLAMSITGLVLSIIARKNLPPDQRGIATAAMVLCIVALPFTMSALSFSGCIICVDIACSGSRCY